MSVDQAGQKGAMLEGNCILNVAGRSRLQDPTGVIAHQSGVRLERATRVKSNLVATFV